MFKDILKLSVVTYILVHIHVRHGALLSHDVLFVLMKTQNNAMHDQWLVQEFQMWIEAEKHLHLREWFSAK